MDLFDQILSREITRRKQVQTERQKELTDPTKTSNLVAKMMRSHVPEGKKIKTSKYPTKLQAVEAAISEEDPRSKLGSNIVASYQKALRNPELSEYRPRNILQAVIENESGKAEIPTRRFIQKQHTGTFSTFMSEPYAPLPDQERWEAENPVPHHMKAEWSALYGAGIKSGLEAGKWALGKGTAAKMGRKKAISLLARGGPWGRVAATGVAAIPGMRIFEEVSERTTQQLMKTEGGKKHPVVANLIGFGVGMAAGAVIPVEAMFGEMLTSKGGRAVTKFQNLIRRRDQAAQKLSENPAAEEIIKFKEESAAADKAATTAVSYMEKYRPQVVAKLVTTLERMRSARGNVIPLSGSVKRRGIFTPEGLEAMRKTGRVPFIQADGVIKYTPEELALARESVPTGVATIDKSRGGLPVPAAIARPGTIFKPTSPISGEPTTIKVPEKGIPIEQMTPNVPAVKPDGSLVSLAPRDMVPYSYKDIKTAEGLDKVLEEVADGKSAADAVQKVGEMEEAVARQSVKLRKIKTTVSLKKKMADKGYDADEVAQMNEKVAANINRFSGKPKDNTDVVNKILSDVNVPESGSKIDQTVLSSKEKLYNWAKGLSDSKRLDMVESGTIPKDINKRIVQEKREAIEQGKEYAEFTSSEAKKDARFKNREKVSDIVVESSGSGSVARDDGSYHVMSKEEFVLKMMYDVAKKTPGKSVIAAATAPAVYGALSMPDEAEAGVMADMAKVFKAATKAEAEAVASKLKLKYNGVQQGLSGPVAHVFTDLERGTTITASTAEESVVLEVLNNNKAMWKALEEKRNTILGAVGFAGLNISLDSILSPGEAEAAGLPDAMRVVSGMTADMLSKAKPGKIVDILKGSKKAKLIGEAQVDHCYILPEPRKAITVTPDYTSLSKKKSLPPGSEALLSPHTQMLYYTGVKDGQELMNNAFVQWANHQSTYVWNSMQGHKTLMNILEDFIPNYKSNSRAVIEEMSDLVEKYNAPLQERAYHYGMTKHFKKTYEKEFGKLSKRRKFKEGEADELLDGVVELEKHYKNHESLFKSSEGIVKEYQAAWDKKVMEIANRPENSGTRVFLAAEDTADFQNYPWLKDIISWEERAAASKIKDMMEHYSVKLLEVGEKIITSRPFMHYAWHPQMKNSLPDLAKQYSLASPPMTKFYSRSVGSRAMVPDAEYSVTAYLQDINVRLEAAEFWKKQQEGGWWAFKKWITENPSQVPEGLIKTFNQFEKGFKPVDTSGGFNRLSETLYACEVGRLLAFSASVPFKHALKLIADLRVFGVEGVKAMPKAASAAAKVAIKQRGGEKWLKDRGWGLDLLDEAVENHTETGKLYRVVSDISPFRVNESQVDKLLNKFNEVGGTPTSIVERFDRSLSVVAGMRMAAKKGMTPAQSTYSVYDTILKANFLSGQLNPSWLKNPAIRLMMIFQGTPFKILEQRAALHGRAWYGVSQTLKQLRRDVIMGEQEFKWAMIKQAFTQQKDIFGQSLLTQSIREMVLVGTAITAGKYFWDADLSHHFIHFPFFKTQKRDIAIGASPVVNASLETYHKYMEEDYDEFIVSTFFNSWFDATYKGLPAPIPVNFKKAARLTENDIPEIYRDSKIRYLFAIPAQED